MDFVHKPVLLNEVIQALNLKPNGLYIDGTVGGGGHSEQILAYSKDIRLIAIDRDKEALAASKERLKKYKNQVTFVHDNFKNIANLLAETGQKIDGILLDLGVSSYQIDNRERGFSFKTEAELDMRMNQTQEYSAKELVNNATEAELTKIIREYGEERFALRVAKKIIENRPITTTTELASIVDQAIPYYKGREINSSVQRVFQAIRIDVNDELKNLRDFILDLPSVMNKKSRIVIISFHSLEDRIVKQAYRELSTECICPPRLPVCICNNKSKGKILTNKPITATQAELKENSRSSSAKLRVFELH